MKTEEISQELIKICEIPDPYIEDESGYGLKNLTKYQRLQINKILYKHFKFKEIRWIDKPFIRGRLLYSLYLIEGNQQHEGEVGYIYLIYPTRFKISPKCVDWKIRYVAI